MPTRTDALPKQRPSRTVVEAVRPLVDGGALPAKATCGEPMTVLADVFTDGHSVVAAALRWRKVGNGSARSAWHECPMTPLGNDRFGAAITPTELGRIEYDVLGWVDHAETWRRDTLKKLDAGLDVTVELAAGVVLVTEMIGPDTAGGPLAAGEGDDPADSASNDRSALTGLHDGLVAGDTASLDHERWTSVFWRSSTREPIARLARPVPVDVDRLIGAFGAWYEFFPRSTTTDTATDTATPDTATGTAKRAPAASAGPVAATLTDAIDRLDHIAAMGFDVVYLPPIHPIGTTKRKGPNNATVAAPDDIGSPWAIGSADGGHTAVAPELGTVDDVDRLVAACRARGMELALDIAFQCSPDHPWVTEHPEWFATRADGSIQFAENPPKKYEDIYPLDFDSPDWSGLWQALADVFRFWIGHGVKIFRVDNPHTKAFAFWQWALATLRREHPDTVFLAEAFTRPRVMERLAKIGFNQSYTYFAWRQASWELREYFEDLATRTADYLRPNAWPNTPDILTAQLQTGGRPAFVTRAILAATLSPSWGVYGPAFELLEDRPLRAGSEEYLDSEKYQLRRWDLDQDDSIAALITRLNEIRRSNGAFRNLETLRFHDTDDPGLLCFTRTDATGATDPILVVVNLDPFQRHSGVVDVDLAAIGLPYESDYDVVDQLGGVTYRWHGNSNYVDLAPWSASAHIFTVRRPAERAADAPAGGRPPTDPPAGTGSDVEVAA